MRATANARFAPRTLVGLADLLLARQTSISRSVGTLRREAVEALSQRDLSDMRDTEEPSADTDAAAALILLQRAERRLWEVEQALARVRDGTYGYCTNCGASVPLERLRALPATTSCFACSGRTSHRTVGRVEERREPALN